MTKWKSDVTGPYTSNRVVRPVTAYPAEHIFVDSKCANVAVGDAISNNGFNPVDCGMPENAFDSSGKAWYAYGANLKGSSNTGFEKADMATLFFVVDDADEGSFAITYDAVSDQKLKTAKLNITSTGLAGNKEVLLEVEDDATDYVPAWNTVDGSLRNAFWEWEDCCSDGLVLGNLPPTDYCLTLTWDHSMTDGFKSVRLGSFDGKTNKVSFVEVSVDTKYPFTPVEVCAFNCIDYCDQFTDTSTCPQDVCAWCNGSCRPDSDGDGVADPCSIGPGTRMHNIFSK